MQKGECGNRDDYEYYQRVYRPEIFAEAEPVRQAIVAAVNSGDCKVLF